MKTNSETNRKASAAMDINFTTEQLSEIKFRLDQGQPPREVANTLGRIADLDLDEIEAVAEAASRLAAGETLTPNDQEH